MYREREREREILFQRAPTVGVPESSHDAPSPPIKSCPIKSPCVKLSGRPPMKFNGHENSHPLEFRVCLSQTL